MKEEEDERIDDTQKIERDHTRRLPRVAVVRSTRRVAVAILGTSILLAGIALALPGVPGPGLLVMLLGLTVLSWEFAWAKRLKHRMSVKVHEMRTKRKQTKEEGQDRGRPDR